ncbi:WYL domain-containing protein [Streptomyces sp. AJS327]|uniref:helix-turn-helix transcriptional regulator n=1 Tax=Streptomyces sp. AJS327 TaxID=2545265 RepID=UPI0015DEEEA2|nr:WYL domain-containing protein [Streptomyces sp. AJS327]MBA0052875.1 WYL domain-containing protein [Streptomyces sp. AJS327]
MRADRLLSLLLLLQNRERMTAPQLAAELEVSVRTVYRDVEALSASGVPVRAERGPEGGYRLMDGYRTRLTGLTDAEAGSLFLTGVPGPARELGLGAALTTAQLKLQAALPNALAERTRHIQERFHLDAPGWFRGAERLPHLATVAQAVWDQRELRVHYRRWRGEVHRDLRPLGVVLKGGIWYLVATPAPRPAPGPGQSAAPTDEPAHAPAHEPGNGTDPHRSSPNDDAPPVRTYRIARLLAAEPTGATFDRPTGFDLAAHWTESTRRLEAQLHQDTAHIRLSSRGQRLLPMLFGAVGALALDHADPPGPDGWAEVQLPVESRHIAVGDLLRLGVEVEVLGPPALREALAETVAALATRYRAGPLTPRA